MNQSRSTSDKNDLQENINYHQMRIKTLIPQIN